jgi:hypothetical protein
MPAARIVALGVREGCIEFVTDEFRAARDSTTTNSSPMTA